MLINCKSYKLLETVEFIILQIVLCQPYIIWGFLFTGVTLLHIALLLLRCVLLAMSSVPKREHESVFLDLLEIIVVWMQ